MRAGRHFLPARRTWSTCLAQRRSSLEVVHRRFQRLTGTWSGRRLVALAGPRRVLASPLVPEEAMKRVLCAVTGLTLALIPFHAAGQGKKKDKDPVVAGMMQKKLKGAQLVLEGVATADYKKIAKNAEHLLELAKSTTWQLIRSPQYEGFSNEFMRAAEKLVKKAQEKNVDGAALAYLEMTLT